LFLVAQIASILQILPSIVTGFPSYNKCISTSTPNNCQAYASFKVLATSIFNCQFSLSYSPVSFILFIVLHLSHPRRIGFYFGNKKKMKKIEMTILLIHLSSCFVPLDMCLVVLWFYVCISSFDLNNFICPNLKCAL
jgi:hypothetical protein